LDARLAKIAIGLALESVIVHKGDAEELASLYSNPDPRLMRETHDRLIESDDHHEREAAIWLEPGLNMRSLRSDPRTLAEEMREMEFVLGTIISRSGIAQREVNYWMDYIANAHQFITDGFWIDAKIFLSRALQTSRAASVEELKSDPGLSYEVETLQRATASYFNEMRGYPLTLNIPEEKLDPILHVQETMLTLMRNHSKVGYSDEAGIARQIVHRLSSAMRHMMQEEKRQDAKRELDLALEQLGEWRGETEDGAKKAEIDAHSRRIKTVANKL
jgi:hypothetical protein